MNLKEKCSVDGCNVEIAHLQYCSRHYQQYRKNGFIRRTGRDGNEFIFEGNICLIKLYDPFGNEKKEKAIIDVTDYEFVRKYRWSLFSGNYVWNNKNKMFLHNLLLNSKNIDHKNGNGLDNRRSNIRKANQSQNNMNKKIAKNNTSGFKGVHYDKTTNKWKLQIRKNRKFVFNKLVNTKEEGAILYNKKAIELFGDFVKINQIEEAGA